MKSGLTQRAPCYIDGMNANPLFWWVRQAIMAGGLMILIGLLFLVAARHAWLPLWPGRVELALMTDAPDAGRARYQSPVATDAIPPPSEPASNLVARNRPWSLVTVELDSGEQLSAYLVAAADAEDGPLHPLPEAWRARRVERPASLRRYALLKLDDGSQWRASLDPARRLFYPNRLDASERLMILLSRVQERWAIGDGRPPLLASPEAEAGLTE